MGIEPDVVNQPEDLEAADADIGQPELELRRHLEEGAKPSSTRGQRSSRP
jgi:hypothetical protein